MRVSSSSLLPKSFFSISSTFTSDVSSGVVSALVLVPRFLAAGVAGFLDEGVGAFRLRLAWKEMHQSLC